MMKDDTFNKIEAWLSGELPEAEARAFEAEMATDAVLAAEVERHRRGREALDRLAEQALQGDMARWRASLDVLPAPPTDALPPKNLFNASRRMLSWLLLLLLVCGAVYWFWPTGENQSGYSPEQQIPPQQTSPNVPIANTSPGKSEEENKESKTTEEIDSRQLIAMAESNLRDMRGTILQQYGQTMGEEDEENPFFTSGVKSFKQNDLKAAKKALLQVPATDPYFPSAQEMLASIYLSEKNFPKATHYYELYARQSADPVADWRLLQFYLCDYQHRKADFLKKLTEITNPDNHHRFQKEAIQIKGSLERMGVK